MRLILISLFMFVIFTVVSCENNTPIEPNSNSGKPVVKIISPTNNTEVSNIVAIQVEATDDKGIVKVEIYIDGILTKEIVVPPYKYNWDTISEQDSTLHLIYAKAYDADENVASSIVINVLVRRYSAPTNFNYELLSDELLNLSWAYSNPSSFSFIIEEAVNGSKFFQIFETNKGVTSAQISKIFYSDTLYRYRVIAKTGSIYSSPSLEQIIYNSIPEPENFSAEILDSNSVKFVWNDVCNYETGYLIEKKEGNAPFTILANLPPNATEYIDNTYRDTIITTYSIKTITAHNESNPVFYTLSVIMPSDNKFTINGGGFSNRTYTFSSDSLVAQVYGYFNPDDSLTVIWMYQVFAPDTIWYWFTFRGTGLGTPSDITMYLYINSSSYVATAGLTGSIATANVTKYSGIGGLIEGTFSGTLVQFLGGTGSVTISNGQFSVIRRITGTQIEKRQRDKIPIEIRRNLHLK